MEILKDKRIIFGISVECWKNFRRSAMAKFNLLLKQRWIVPMTRFDAECTAALELELRLMLIWIFMEMVSPKTFHRGKVCF